MGPYFVTEGSVMYIYLRYLHKVVVTVSWSIQCVARAPEHTDNDAFLLMHAFVCIYNIMAALGQLK